MNGNATTPIPVYRALLPTADAIVPYLRRADANRWYTNRGELTQLLESRLTERLGQAGVFVASAANGTVAIEAALLAAAGRATAERPLALLPAHTFVATAGAAEACGYRPYLVDVDADTWAVAPEHLIGHPALARAGAVVVVAPYGRAVPQAAWADFQARTGVPVVIDAAASIEALVADPQQCVGRIPVTLSFQSTKAFSSGEGGAVVWSDAERLPRIAQALNFGFLYKRESTSAGTNGKLSEYHAAVGLAALDAWEVTAAANARIAQAYRAAAERYGVARMLFVAPTVASNYALLDAGSPESADALMAALANELIESRLWYGRGLHREPYWSTAERDPLPVTERLASALIGLPMAVDLGVDAIERIIAVVARVLRPLTASLRVRER